MNFITKEELISFQNKVVDDDQMAQIQTYCNAGMEAVRNYLGYDPSLQEYTTEEWGDGGKLFALEAYPITGIIDVLVMGLPVDRTLFKFGKKKNYVEYRDRTCFNKFNLYTFRYNAGFATIPAEIKTVALQIASLYWESAGGNLAVSSTTFADTGSRVFNNFEKDRFLKTIADYRLKDI